jgi:hypothetical protein
MRVLTAIWQWFLRRHWFIKIWIVLIIISAIGSAFSNSVDNNSLSIGDCVVDAGIIPTANMENSVSAPTSFEVVDCMDPRATAKVLHIKEMYKQDWTDKQWQNYAGRQCPEMTTSFTYPKGLISDRFTCWLDEYAYGLRINLETETIEETN